MDRTADIDGDRNAPKKKAPRVKYILSAVGFYLAYCAFLFLMQRQMMFPRGLVEIPPGGGKPPAGVERIWLSTSAGKVESWFLPPAEVGSDPAPAAIFAHGNGEVIDFWPQVMSPFIDAGAGVLLVEYPGYGRSQGNPSQETITEAFTTAYDMLVRREGVDPERIILMGRSLGGGAVCRLAARRPSAALILMSTFTSARAFAIRYLAPGFLVRDPFDNLSVVRDYSGPVLILHGRHDEVIPHRHAKALENAAGDGRLISYDAGHNDCPPDWNRFWADVTGFLRQEGILPSEEEDRRSDGGPGDGEAG